MKRIIISESQVNGVVDYILNETPAYLMDYYNSLENTSTIEEIARINKKESGNSIFPYNIFNVHIWSNDHNPPHFHVESNGWDLSFLIESGDFYKLNSSGNDKQTYNYIIKNVKKWLNMTCAVQPKLTNKENAELQWESLH